MMTMFKQMMAGVRAARAARALRASNGPAGRFGRVGRMAQRGLSMLEISLVMIVIAIVLVAVYVGFQQNQRRAEINENVAAITQIISTAQARFGKTGGYTGLSTAIAVQSRLIPDNLRITGGNTAQNSYGGLITVAPVTCVQTGDCLELQWTRTPSSQCAEIVMAVVNSVRRVHLPPNTNIKALDGALTVASLGTQCDSAANIDLVFTIGRGA
jgi:prepilin-type N-terminal cleavage/methylation domain-containing protein